MSKKSFGQWFWEEFKEFIAELSIKAKLILSFGFIIILIVLISTSTSNNTKPDEKQEGMTMNSKSGNSDFQTEFDKLCNSIIKNTPDDNRSLAAAFYNIANDSARKKYYDTSIKLYNKSLQYVDNDPSVYNNMASSYKYLGEIEKAKALYKKSLEIDPDYKNANLQLAFLHALQHNKQEALKYFHIYEEQDPSARTRIKYSLELEIKRGDVSLGGKELLEYITNIEQTQSISEQKMETKEVHFSKRVNDSDINAKYRSLTYLRTALIGKNIDEVRSIIRIPAQTTYIGGIHKPPVLSWEEIIVNTKGKAEPTLLVVNFEWNDDSGLWICNGVD